MFKFSGEKSREKGIYIVLFVVTGIMLSSGALYMTKRDMEKEIASISEKPKGTPVPIVIVNPTPKPLPMEEIPLPSPTVTPTAESTAEPAKEFLPVWPVNGEVVVPFADNSLVYSKTMNDWRTHRGIDIKSSILSRVDAIFDGTVKDVYKDTMMGITIVIDHGEGIESVYSNLSTEEMVKKGQWVKTGSAISGVGDTALMETGEEAHLHFEIRKDGINQNPLDYLK